MSDTEVNELALVHRAPVLLRAAMLSDDADQNSAGDHDRKPGHANAVRHIRTTRTHDVGFFYRRNSEILGRTVGILKVRTDSDGRTDVGDFYNQVRVDLSRGI